MKRSVPGERVGRVLLAVLLSCLLILACNALLGRHDFGFTPCATNADCAAPLVCSAGGTCFCANPRFGSPGAVLFSYSAGVGPTSVVAVDLNDDGKPDIVVANSGDDTVSVLLGNGDGTFQSQTTYPTGSGPVVGRGPVDPERRRQARSRRRRTPSDNTVGVLIGNGDGTVQSLQQGKTTRRAPARASGSRRWT